MKRVLKTARVNSVESVMHVNGIRTMVNFSLGNKLDKDVFFVSSGAWEVEIPLRKEKPTKISLAHGKGLRSSVGSNAQLLSGSWNPVEARTVFFLLHEKYLAGLQVFSNHLTRI